MLTGVYSIDEGTVFWEDQPVKIPNPSQSRTLGINVVHQDRTLIPTFDGVENAYLGREYPHKGMQVDWKTMWETVEKTRDELGIELDLSKMAIELSPPQKTCLEIIRAMMNDCKLLILDEPTASLTDKESEILFDIIGKLKKKGTSVLYVSHRMDEIFRLTDRITVFKNGSMVSCVKTSEVDKDKLVSMMTDEWKGSDIVHNTNFGKVLLEVQGIRTKDGVMKRVLSKFVKKKFWVYLALEEADEQNFWKESMDIVQLQKEWLRLTENSRICCLRPTPLKRNGSYLRGPKRKGTGWKSFHQGKCIAFLY